MKIIGLQKLTVIDYPNKIACTLFLHGCNFRCGFCYNPGLVLENNEEGYSKEEILKFLRERRVYLSGVCISGGEPLLTLDLDFLRQIKELGYNIKIDTNGSFPERLREVIERGLVDYVAMDVKGSKEDYEQIANSKIDIEKIEESMRIVSGFKDYEFRTTIVKKYHDAEKIKSLAEWLNSLVGKPKKLCLQGFKNNGKFLDLSFMIEKDVEEDCLLDLKKVAEPYFEQVDVRI